MASFSLVSTSIDTTATSSSLSTEKRRSRSRHVWDQEGRSQTLSKTVLRRITWTIASVKLLRMVGSSTTSYCRSSRTTTTTGIGVKKQKQSLQSLFSDRLAEISCRLRVCSHSATRRRPLLTERERLKWLSITFSSVRLALILWLHDFLVRRDLFSRPCCWEVSAFQELTSVLVREIRSPLAESYLSRAKQKQSTRHPVPRETQESRPQFWVKGGVGVKVVMLHTNN